MIEAWRVEMDNVLMYDFSTWPVWFCILYASVIIIGLHILTLIVPMLFSSAAEIPKQGPHLDELEWIDTFYVTINKCLTVFFVYHVIYVCYHSESIKLAHEDATLMNTLGSLALFYTVYDFFYMWFHRILHWDAFYKYVHKHHHRQKAPSRGNIDAINVHPFEFLVGEYLHLFTIYMIPCHIYAVIFFILAGGILASLNHTRYDINIPGFFCVKAHDVHHVHTKNNYAQYTMYWDKLHGTYSEHQVVKKNA